MLVSHGTFTNLLETDLFGLRGSLTARFATSNSGVSCLDLIATDNEVLVDALFLNRVDHLPWAEQASAQLRQTVVRGFRAAAARAAAAYGDQDGLKDGNLPLTDPAVVGVWL